MTDTSKGVDTLGRHLISFSLFKGKLLILVKVPREVERNKAAATIIVPVF